MQRQIILAYTRAWHTMYTGSEISSERESIESMYIQISILRSESVCVMRNNQIAT